MVKQLTFQEIAEQQKKHTEQKQFVDLLIRGVQPLFGTIKTYCKEGYTDIMLLREAIDHIDTRQDATETSIIALRNNFVSSPYAHKTKQELETILQEKRETYASTRGQALDLQTVYALERVAQRAGIDLAEVKKKYSEELTKRTGLLQLLIQGAKANEHFQVNIIELEELLRDNKNARYLSTDHPCYDQLQSFASVVEKLCKKMNATQEVSFNNLQGIQNRSKQLIHLLQNLHYAGGGTTKSISAEEKQLISYLESLQESIAVYMTEQITRYKDTQMASNADHLLRISRALEKGIVVEGLPSREHIVEKIHTHLMKRNNVVLTGPAGTGKTELAKYVQRQIITDLYATKQITQEDYTLLIENLPYLSGNPDATKSELRGKRAGSTNHTTTKQTDLLEQIGDMMKTLIQKDEHPELTALLSKKLGELSVHSRPFSQELFSYVYSNLEISMKYGAPIIIDEFLRYPESLLAYLKFFWSRKPGEKMTLSNGETITLRTTNFIATTNEGEKYGLFAKDFINREYEDVKVGYIADEELSNLVRAWMLHRRGFIPYIPASFFARGGAVHRTIEAMKEIDEIRFNGKEETFTSGVINSSGKFTQNAKGKLQTAVFDTKRFLERFDLQINDLLMHGPDKALARSICDFIVSSSSYDNDKYILIRIFSKKGLISSAQKSYLEEIDPQAMKKHDQTANKKSIIDENLAIVFPPEQQKRVSTASSVGFADLAELALSPVYGNDLDTLPLSSDNPRLLEKRTILTTLKQHYGDVSSIMDAIEAMQNFPSITDTNLASLRDARATYVETLPDNKKKLGAYDTFLGLQGIEKLRDDTEQGKKFRADQQARQDALTQKLKKPPRSKKKTTPEVPHTSFQLLTSGAEYDRITTFRTNFKQQITGTINHKNGIDGIIAIAKSMIADKSFRLSTCGGGLPMGEYHLDGTSYGIVNAGNVLTEADYNADNANISSCYYDHTLRPGTSYEPRRKAIKEQNLTKRQNATIRNKIQPALDAGGVPMHHTGADKTHNDFYDTCQAIMKKYTLSENDALLIMMYLQGLYGRYWVGGNRGCVGLGDVDRGFDSNGSGGSSASLLVSVKNHLLSPGGGPGGTPLSPEAQARFDEGKIEYDRMQQWRDNNVVNDFGTTLIDQNTGQSQNYADELALKTELSKRIEALRTAGHINLLPPPGLDLCGVTVQFTHPSRNNGTPKHFYEGQRVDYEILTGAPSDNCYSKYNGNFANQKRLCVNLRSIRGDINAPDTLDDTVWADQKNKTGRTEKNYTKIYLQALKDRQPTMKIASKKENEDFIGQLGTILGIPVNNQKLQLMAFQKILSFGGDFWRSDYTGTGNRGDVSLGGGDRGFYTHYSDDNFASLLVSRDGWPEGQATPEALAHATYREKMVSWAEKHDTQYLDEIKQWHEITNELIDTGQIKQSADGVEMVGLGFEMLRKSVHDDLVRKNFPGQYSEKTDTDHVGFRTNLEVRKDVMDTFIQDKKSFGEGIDIGGEKEHLEKMLAWIANKYHTNDTTKQLYILQMINPDLYGWYWMKDTTGNYRHHCLELLYNVYTRNVSKDYNADKKCGLFLVRNLTPALS